MILYLLPKLERRRNFRIQTYFEHYVTVTWFHGFMILIIRLQIFNITYEVFDTFLCLNTVSQHLCHNREQPKAERQRGTQEGGIVARNFLRLVQNHLSEEDSQGLHLLYQ